MGGELDMTAIPLFLDLFDIQDPELFMIHLCTVRDIQRELAEAERDRE